MFDPESAQLPIYEFPWSEERVPSLRCMKLKI